MASAVPSVAHPKALWSCNALQKCAHRRGHDSQRLEHIIELGSGEINCQLLIPVDPRRVLKISDAVLVKHNSLYGKPGRIVGGRTLRYSFCRFKSLNFLLRKRENRRCEEDKNSPTLRAQFAPPAVSGTLSEERGDRIVLRCK